MAATTLPPRSILNQTFWFALASNRDPKDGMDFAINHITAPRLRWSELLDLAAGLGCIGVEFRNDLSKPLFSGNNPGDVAQAARDAGLRILGLSQVYPFNQWSNAVRTDVSALISTAKACGAETISLIPRNDGLAAASGERQSNLRAALREIKPMLADARITALVEPLGFERASLRYKSEAIDAIEAIGGQNEFKIVHDTFHHFLAGEREFFPEWTGIVHISGVTDRSISPRQMEDEHRVLVGAGDRLGNVAQLRALQAAGYRGPISVEAFSPKVHAFDDPAPCLAASIEFIKAQLRDTPA